MPKSKPIRIFIGLLLILGAICFLVWPHLPTSDPATYFDFVDTRSFGSIPNALNVISNLAFLWAGILGMKKVFERRRLKDHEFFIYGISLSVASVMTCFGSAYFHWNPNPATLVWDRLPMTVGFASIGGMFIADRIDRKLGLYSFVVLIILGMFSIIGFTQSWVTLRPYIVVQFGTLLFLTLGLLFLKTFRISNSLWWTSLSLYLVAKVFELADAQVFDLTGVISGHTLKHLFAALSIYKVLSLFNGSAK